MHVVRRVSDQARGLALGGELVPKAVSADAHEVLASLPGLFPEWLGDRSFMEVHGCRFPYVLGAMANGIATVEMVAVAAEAGLLGFYGAAGQSIPRVADAVAALQKRLGDKGLPWGSNLIHSPHEPLLEQHLADLYLAQGVVRVSASAYMGLTLPLVYYACKGLHRGPQGAVRRKHHVFAKLSRLEVAEHFLTPAPAPMLSELVRQGKLTAQEAELAREVPLAEDITVEADSGGHTDRQCLVALFPTVANLAARKTREYDYPRPIRCGAAGGLGTPAAVSAAFSLGAAYVLTGTVNQACVESGLDVSGRRLLAAATTADVVMTPASDMFELGVKLQVLKRGTMYASRAAKLYDLYRAYAGIDHIPEPVRQQLEKEVFRLPLSTVWQQTREFWQKRDPTQVERAERDDKHRMALCFRWYLGLSSKWAMDGVAERSLDYQIWCGPAMGAFNDWVCGSFLEPVDARRVTQVARNLLEGAAYCARAQQLRSLGLPLPEAAFRFRPRILEG